MDMKATANRLDYHRLAEFLNLSVSEVREFRLIFKNKLLEKEYTTQQEKNVFFLLFGRVFDNFALSEEENVKFIASVRKYGIDLNKLEDIFGRIKGNAHRLKAHMFALRNKFLNDPGHPDSDILPHLMKLERTNVVWT